ncbi:hypothetical protein V1517DRAFT_336838 [Lipomyces orientalis]|uniref:Uncharacterized protein n=1 Tax=Lipomyces orientalis TaxID=1233043 RepID=A0ACC3TT99_9ASCO
MSFQYSLGYDVRGTVRTPRPWLDQYFKGKYGEDKFESVVLPVFDLDSLDHVMDGVSGVIHGSACNTDFSPDPNVVIPGVVKGTLNILETALKHKSVTRVVLTSSSAACLFPKPGVDGIEITQETWNDESLGQAWGETIIPETDRPFAVYAASKTESERKAWEWMKEHQPGFVFNTVLPNTNWGRVLLPQTGGSTGNMLRGLLKGNKSGMQSPPQWFVNVEDTARLHAIALLDPSVTFERLFAFAAPQNWNDVIEIIRKLRPDNPLIPDPPVNEPRDLSNVPGSKRAAQLLSNFFGQPRFIGLEDTIAATIEGLN